MYVVGWSIKKVKNPGYLSIVRMVVFSLLICTLRNDFEGGRQVVLVRDPEKKLSLYYKPFFLTVENQKKIRVEQLLRVQIKGLFGFYD